MIAVDTNVLVHAHRGEAPFHAVSVERLREVQASPWAVPWPCIHEFLAIVTHPRVFQSPSPWEDARAFVDGLLAIGTLRVLAELPGYWEVLSNLVSTGKVTGPRIHDARIAAICVQHGISELWTADRDFGRFSSLRVRNPLA